MSDQLHVIGCDVVVIGKKSSIRTIYGVGCPLRAFECLGRVDIWPYLIDLFAK